MDIETERTDKWDFRLPKDAQILCVQTQRSVPCLWAVVDESVESVTRTFQIVGTGHELPSGKAAYIGTFQLQNGYFVGHAHVKTPEIEGSEPPDGVFQVFAFDSERYIEIIQPQAAIAGVMHQRRQGVTQRVAHHAANGAVSR